MLARHQLPEDAADWRSVAVVLDRLSVDSPDSCPIAQEEVFEYVRMESADVDRAAFERLHFMRTASFLDAHAWLWRYVESDDAECFVTVFVRADGTIVTGLAEPKGLSEEQFLLAEYYDEVYWS